MLSRPHRVTQYRDVDLAPLSATLAGYAEVGQQRWLAWLKRNRMDSAMPNDFSKILDLVFAFSDTLTAVESPREDLEPDYSPMDLSTPKGAAWALSERSAACGLVPGDPFSRGM
jgi:hypothetical protein